MNRRSLLKTLAAIPLLLIPKWAFPKRPRWRWKLDEYGHWKAENREYRLCAWPQYGPCIPAAWSCAKKVRGVPARFLMLRSSGEEPTFELAKMAAEQAAERYTHGALIAVG